MCEFTKYGKTDFTKLHNANKTTQIYNNVQFMNMFLCWSIVSLCCINKNANYFKAGELKCVSINL